MNNNEEYLSKKRALELWDKNLLENLESGTFESLQFIHEYLFQDVFEFAGKIRTVNISKGNFRFASFLYLNTALQDIEKMPENTFEKISKNISQKFRNNKNNKPV